MHFYVRKMYDEVVDSYSRIFSGGLKQGALFLVIPKQTGPELNWSDDEEMSEVQDGTTVFSL